MGMGPTKLEVAAGRTHVVERTHEAFDDQTNTCKDTTSHDQHMT